MEDTTQGKIWRINMKTDGIYKFEQQGVFDFCVNSLFSFVNKEIKRIKYS